MSETGRSKSAKGPSAKRKTGNVAEILREGDHLRISPGSKLTAIEAHDLQLALKQEIANGAREVVFDMKETITLDSTGIGLLVAASNSLRTVQGGIRLVNVKNDIFKLLRSMRLVERLRVSPEEEQVNNG
ncbi:MAG: STAS domain-containing protein [Syntrophaceae bacterium]|jgi:anti-anti-sigma factor|nr:STAS domain-containing protein [Syntrophaceae bacterium]